MGGKMIEHEFPQEKWNVIIRRHIYNCWDGYTWFLFTCLFALIIPTIARLAIPNFNYTLENFFLEGDIPLFSMVVMTSLVIDHFVFEEGIGKLFDTTPKQVNSTKSSKLKERVIVFIIPMVLIAGCLIIYLRCQSLQRLQYVDGYTIAIEIIVFLIVAEYAAFLKSRSFDKNKTTG